VSRLTQWIQRKYVNPLVEQQVALRLHEAAAARVDSIDADEDRYRRLTGQSKRDLPTIKHSRMIEIAHYLYNFNPLAKWLLTTQRDFICSEGITLRAKDEKNQPVLDTFWNDAINRFPLKLPIKVLELALFGEQFYPIFTNKFSGMVRLGNIDPSRVKTVICDPHNSEEFIGVILAASGDDTGALPGKKLRIVKTQPDEEIFHPDTVALRKTFTDGECFHYKINSTSHQTRGISDLFSLSDWVDSYESLLFDTRDRVAYLNAFTWDVMLRGKNDQEIKDWITANPPPMPGAWFGHNENTELNPKTPDLQGRDNSENARLFRNHILGAANIPEHFYGGAGDVNRATAQVMDLPMMKNLQARQLVIKYMIEDIVKFYLIHTHEAKQEDLNDVDEYFTVVFPKIDAKDITVAASNLVSVTTAASVAEDRGWIEFSHAQRLFIAASALLGVDLPTGDLPTEPPDREQTPEYLPPRGTTPTRTPPASSNGQAKKTPVRT